MINLLDNVQSANLNVKTDSYKKDTGSVEFNQSNSFESMLNQASVDSEKTAAKVKSDSMVSEDEVISVRDIENTDSNKKSIENEIDLKNNNEPQLKKNQKPEKIDHSDKIPLALKIETNKEITINLNKLPENVKLVIQNKMEQHSKGEISTEKLKHDVKDILQLYFKGNVKAEKVIEQIPDSKLIVQNNSKKDIEKNKDEVLLKPIAKEDKKTELAKSDVVNFNANENNINPKTEKIEKNDSITSSRIAQDKQNAIDDKKSEKINSIKETKADFGKELNQIVSEKADVKVENLVKQFNENKTETFENITKQTKIVLTNNEMKFSTFIRPEELGRMDFKFDIKDGKISGRVILQSQEAADIFRSNVEELRAVFQKSNVELDKLEITVAGKYLESQENGFDFSQGHSGQSEKESSWYVNKAIDYIEDTMVTTDRMYNAGETGVNLYA
ncbi:MAG: hypothetical protein A2015_14160 [Spirochaetes bacterium GWF1_31_7]|nr:MAG: hypothetical protein A2Y30_03590 [Spirochaetes bacterium GWE1_32_154]OHD45251.1 MAG: hypothetical protein A2Y29_02355 [Spirochaetes bacterium GWE2_31_10]OHD50546.1 MAG: hypothetical protein A2015_14160 [Spirochaetes bacterium GWF1_31_7]OHD82493.1 MAG: hypothetical protein A2355_16085 [Spirochaetes bacterium RIFOXYB1_FULL_32_8]HBD94196.1 hypothetical protein [Spirochaetia bacterium]